MDQLDIQVGKTYVVEVPWDENDTDPSRVLVKIEGLVDKSTQEYDLGYRFFTHLGLMVFPNGSIISSRSDESDLVLALNRLATAADFKNDVTAFTSVTVAKVELDECRTSLRWLANDHLSFSVKLGEVYADRMGFLRFVDRIRNLSEDLVFVSQTHNYTIKGRNLDHISDENQSSHPKPSMYDLIFQRL